MRLIGTDEQDAVANFLNHHAATSMFPLENLQRHGMQSDHPRGCSFWVNDAAGEITDVLTISNEGIVFPQCPSGFWDAAADVLRGLKIKGFIGAAGQVAAIREKIGLTKPAQLDEIEPFYRLSLGDLVLPNISDFQLKPLTAVSRDILLVWRAAYSVESLAIPSEDAVLQAEVDIEHYIKADSHRVLLRDGVPISMTGFNAMSPHTVQVGGVYTPPDLRSNGYARAALALHLGEAHAHGVNQAVLFAANPAAEKAYQALGFVRDGSFALTLYEEPQHV